MECYELVGAFSTNPFELKYATVELDHFLKVLGNQTSLNPKHSMGLFFLTDPSALHLYGKLIVRQICQFHEECLEMVGAQFIFC